MQEGITSHNKTTKHVVTVAILTILFGYISAYALPSVVNTSGINLMTAFAIFLAAILSAIATSSNKFNTGNMVLSGLVGAAIASIITAMLYGALGLGFSAVWAFVFVGSFIATLVSKKFNK